jgi:tetratricopeptide (TPR) repeat protein
MRLLKMLGHLPVLLHHDPKDVLIIGLGAGVAGGVISSYPSVRNVTVVELSEEVPGGAALFSDWNFDVLKNPKVHIVINDGANYVKATRRQYDIIGSDPIHPFLMGNGILYSLEHWKTCKEHLREGGVLAQWLPMYQLSPSDFATVVRTFTEAFPDATMWFSGVDVVLIGVKGNGSMNLSRVAEHMSDPAMMADLLSMGISKPSDLFGWIVAGPEQLQKMGANGKVNRVDYPVLEFTAPKAILLRGVAATMPLLLTAMNQTSDPVFWSQLQGLLAQPLEKPAFEDVAQARRAQSWIMLGLLAYSDGDNSQYLDYAEKAQSLRPQDQFMKQALADAQICAAYQRETTGFPDEAYLLYRDAYANDPTRAEAVTGAVGLAIENEDTSQAEEMLALAFPRHGHAFQMLVYQGLLALMREDYTMARRAFEQSMVHGQESPLLLTGLGILALRDRQTKAAHALFKKALAISTKQVETLHDIVNLCATHGFRNDAQSYAPMLVKAAADAIASHPGLPKYYYYRALGRTILGKTKDAARE